MPLPPVPIFQPIANADAIVTAQNVRFTVLTDRLIRLEFSADTIKGHVSNILSKLHLADRTQVAVYAWPRGIVQRETRGKA